MKNRNLPFKIAALFLAFSFGNLHAQDFKSIIKNHLLEKNTFKKTDLSNFEIINHDFSRSMNSDVVMIQQYYNSIPVYNSVGTALVKDLRVNYFNENFAKDFNTAVLPTSAKPRKIIFAEIGKAMALKDAPSYELINFGEADKEHAFAKTRLTYYIDGSNNFRLCHQFEFQEKGSSNYWDVLADASTGEILSKQNLNLSCSFDHGTFGRNHAEHIADEVLGHFVNNAKDDSFAEKSLALAPMDASYRVFPFPLESPNHGPRQLLSNPWFSDASPDGWHTISGGTYVGSHNTTRGNNVMAYDDRSNSNAAGQYADGGANRIFDFPFTVNDTTGNLTAATTNLFYVNNKIHDIFYSLGFNETSRNFQAWNFGKGGLQNDYVMAESQDGGGTNNANFSSPSDGGRPRMQMFLWDPAIIERVFYNAPAEAVGRQVPNVVSTTFGPALNATGVTADVKMSPVLDACTPLPTGSLAGKIGLILRGGCEFQAKVQAAQDAGAVAAIIYSLPDSTPTGGMAGTNPNITIPSVLIENLEGVYMKGLLDTGTNVNITLKYDPATQPTRDASFDNGIIIHEYGHGISNRRTGTGSSCLNSNVNKEQMGEGWSDFFALMLTNQPGDNASVARGIGTYAITEPISGTGIRPAPYSPNFSVNNYTYGKTNGMEYVNASGVLTTDVHSVGFVWATMLWDLHWKYVEKYGYSSDVMANSTNGSTRVLQLVYNALALQGCNPGFIEGRNAIIAADQAATGGENKCMIWDVFAKRGLGINAASGSKTNINDQVESFDVPAECILATSDVNAANALSIYPNPAKDEFFLKSGKNILGKVNVEIFDATGKLVSRQKISAADAVNTQSFVNGVYVVKVTGLGVNYSSKLMIKK